MLRPVAIAGLFLFALLLSPSASAGTCGGTWIASASCSFACSGTILSVSGFAQNPTGMPASITVTGSCGIVSFDGTFTPLFTVSCSAGGNTPVVCGNAGPSLPGLVGVCSVSGNDDGTFTCSA